MRISHFTTPTKAGPRRLQNRVAWAPAFAGVDLMKRGEDGRIDAQPSSASSAPEGGRTMQISFVLNDSIRTEDGYEIDDEVAYFKHWMLEHDDSSRLFFR